MKVGHILYKVTAPESPPLSTHKAPLSPQTDPSALLSLPSSLLLARPSVLASPHRGAFSCPSLRSVGRGCGRSGLPALSFVGRSFGRLGRFVPFGGLCAFRSGGFRGRLRGVCFTCVKTNQFHFSCPLPCL